MEKKKKDKSTFRKELEELIVRKPKKNWRVDKGKIDGISYEVLLKLNPKYEELKSTLKGLSRILDLKKMEESKLEIIHTEEFLRLKTINSGIYGQDIIIIRDQEGNGLYINSQVKAFIQFDQEQLPKNTIDRKFKYKIEKEEKLIDGKIQRITVLLERPNRIKWELWIDTDKNLQAYSERITKTLLGKENTNASFPIKEIASIGVPVRCEVYNMSKTNKAGDILISEFTINNLMTQMFPNEMFRIPEEYLDIREKSKEKTKIHETVPIKKIASFRSDLVLRHTEYTRFPAQTEPKYDIPLNIPNCLESDYNSLLAMNIEQLPLEHIKRIINMITTRIQGFRGDNGKFIVNWMEQFENYAVGIGGDDLYTMLSLFLPEEYGYFEVDYPIEYDPIKILDDLIKVEISNISFVIGFQNKSIVEKLSFTDFGEIIGQLKIPEINFGGDVETSPTYKYIGIQLAPSGLRSIIAAILGVSAEYLPVIELVESILVYDFGTFTGGMSNFDINFELKCIPGTHFFFRTQSLEIVGDLDIDYSSSIPIPLYNLIRDIIINIILHFCEDNILETLVNGLKEIIDANLLKLEMFPFKQLPFPPNNITQSRRVDRLLSKREDHIYFETNFPTDITNFGDGFGPFLTQIDARDLYPLLLKHGKVFEQEYKNYYGSIAISQNYLNHYLYSLWREQSGFFYVFEFDERTELIGRLNTIFGRPLAILKVHFWVAAPPRLVYSPILCKENRGYATTFFDDIRLCLIGKEKPPEGIEIKFSAAVPTQIGIGGIDHGSPEDPDTCLTLAKIEDKVIDLYFDVEKTEFDRTVEIIQPIETQEITSLGPTYVSDLDLLTAMEDSLKFAVNKALKSKTSSIIINEDDTPCHQIIKLMREIPGIFGHETGFFAKINVEKGIMYIHLERIGLFSEPANP